MFHLLYPVALGWALAASIYFALGRVYLAFFGVTDPVGWLLEWAVVPYSADFVIKQSRFFCGFALLPDKKVYSYFQLRTKSIV